ncbi:MAG: hypothetical protein JNL22_04980 [Bacteroidales bacterium]|jgi:hypothetical protein|nr:hypothetical protein [Bacteroidales bacterium]
MAAIELIKTRLIDKILATKNRKLLEAIDTIFSSALKEEDEILKLSSEQIEMLLMSEEDIKNNNLITETELQKLDKEWLG